MYPGLFFEGNVVSFLLGYITPKTSYWQFCIFLHLLTKILFYIFPQLHCGVIYDPLQFFGVNKLQDVKQ